MNLIIVTYYVVLWMLNSKYNSNPLHFLRSKMKRMITDPRPETIFPGGRSRVYRRNEITGQWILEQCEDDQNLWAGSDLRVQFNWQRVGICFCSLFSNDRLDQSDLVSGLKSVQICYPAAEIISLYSTWINWLPEPHLSYCWIPISWFLSRCTLLYVLILYLDNYIKEIYIYEYSLWTTKWL